MASKFEERLDKMIEAARASEHPYAALEGKPFNLSASVARTLVVGSGLSKSAPKVVEREKARIARWLKLGSIGPAKAKPNAKPKPKPRTPAPDVEATPDEAIAIPEAVAEAVTAHAEKATRKRSPRKDGKASDTVKAIARNRTPVAATE